MNNSKFLLVFLLIVIAGFSFPITDENNLNLINSKSPIELTEIEASFYKDIRYRQSENNRFDIFLPKSENKTPLVIFVHGGGFVGGDKSHAYKNDYPQQIRTLLKNKIAFATINYRFLTNPESKGVITSLNDSKTCLQFIRYNADKFNIDKTKIGIYGSSAGSGTALWLGLHNEMQNLDSKNPIERESTRINAVGAKETQATYDIVKWGTIVFKPFNITLEMLAKSGMEKTLFAFYRINNLDDLYSETTTSYRNNVDFLTLMSNDDPPIFVRNSKYSAGVPKSKKELNHHPLHAKVLKEYADSIGLESIFYIPKLGISDSTGISLVDFMIEKLN